MKTQNNKSLFNILPLRFLKLSILSAVILGITLSLSACNTMHGLGKDVEKTGEAIQKSSR